MNNINNPIKISKFEQSILKVFTLFPYEPMNARQIAARLNVVSKGSNDILYKTMLKMVTENLLIKNDQNKFKLNTKFLPALSPDNFAYGYINVVGRKVYVEREDNGQLLSIKKQNTLNACHQDRVKIYILPKRAGKEPEAQVCEVIQRVKTTFVGMIKCYRKQYYLSPDSIHVPFRIHISKANIKGLKDGMKALVKVINWNEDKEYPEGEIIQNYGCSGSNEAEMMSILSEYNFSPKFQLDTLKEIQSLSKKKNNKPQKFTKREKAGRLDYTQPPTFTIDPDDAKDFDDALSIKTLSDGLFEIGVHIADVSSFVQEGSAIDKEALERATSVYLVDRVIPMLPEKLSNDLCSLKPKEERLTFSVIFIMNDKAEVLNYKIIETVILSDRRFTYDEAQKILEGENGDFANELRQLWNIANILRQDRFKKGAINFESEEVKFILDEKKRPIEIKNKILKEANYLVEEFMLLANQSVARYIGCPKERKEKKAFVYRIHDIPNTEKLSQFTEYAAKSGYKIDAKSRLSLAKSLNKLFLETKNTPNAVLFSSIALRTMSKAYYSTDNIGHYGLGMKFYTHFTSPIRRYPDLMVHRLLKKYMESGKSADKVLLEKKCEHCSQMEKQAEMAERTSIKYKQAEFLQGKEGKSFTGVVSGVTKFGIFVLLDYNKCEGLVQIEGMDDDYYYLDEKNYAIVGKNFGQEYKIGMKVKVKVLSVDLLKKQIDFFNITPLE
jgi:ribonuclease R